MRTSLQDQHSGCALLWRNGLCRKAPLLRRFVLADSACTSAVNRVALRVIDDRCLPAHGLRGGSRRRDARGPRRTRAVIQLLRHDYNKRYREHSFFGPSGFVCSVAVGEFRLGAIAANHHGISFARGAQQPRRYRRGIGRRAMVRRRARERRTNLHGRDHHLLSRACVQ
jgi:hypothetical protein